jgi:hypothetical protein
MPQRLPAAGDAGGGAEAAAAAVPWGEDVATSSRSVGRASRLHHSASNTSLAMLAKAIENAARSATSSLNRAAVSGSTRARIPGPWAASVASASGGTGAVGGHHERLLDEAEVGSEGGSEGGASVGGGEDGDEGEGSASISAAGSARGRPGGSGGIRNTASGHAERVGEGARASSRQLGSTGSSLASPRSAGAAGGSGGGSAAGGPAVAALDSTPPPALAALPLPDADLTISVSGPARKQLAAGGTHIASTAPPHASPPRPSPSQYLAMRADLAALAAALDALRGGSGSGSGDSAGAEAMWEAGHLADWFATAAAPHWRLHIHAVRARAREGPAARAMPSTRQQL